jgi:hypothetical protein
MWNVDARNPDAITALTAIGRGLRSAFTFTMFVFIVIGSIATPKIVRQYAERWAKALEASVGSGSHTGKLTRPRTPKERAAHFLRWRRSRRRRSQ